MFCPNCGNADQSPETYCRKCGEFLTAGNTSLISQIVGANTPDKRVNIGLAFDALTFICSLLLLIFLFGYFDGRFTKTGEASPPIIYLIYVFLGLTAVWQLMSLVIGFSHKGKLAGRKKFESKEKSEDVESYKTTLLPESTQDYLPPANLENIVTPSVVEDTTKQLARKIPK